MKIIKKILTPIAFVLVSSLALTFLFVTDMNSSHRDVTHSTKIDFHKTTWEGNYVTFSVDEKQIKVSVEESQLDKIKTAQKESEEICLNIDAYDLKVDYRLSETPRTYTIYALKDVWPASSCPPAYKQGERNSGF